MMDLLFGGRQLVFQSPLSRDELRARMRMEVQPSSWPRRSTGAHRFEGSVADDRFRMMRRVQGRNSFRPIVEGDLTAAAYGARVSLRLRVHPVVVAFCALTSGFAGFVAVLAAPDRISLIVALGVAGLLAAFNAAMHYEARQTTRLLASVFETEPLRM